MKFRTELVIPPSDKNIDHRSGVITLGSCFAEVIGTRFEENKFDVLANPFGTIFNPLSLSMLLKKAIQGEYLPDESFINTRGVWFNYYFHSSIWALSKEALQEKLQELLLLVKRKTEKVRFLVLTLGTAYVYKLEETGSTVSNCHKMPSDYFSKILLNQQEIVRELQETLLLLKKVNPELEVIISVSPVRHIKDTIPLNTVSKSILRISAHQLSEDLDFATYFPAYEIIMDDLRDYRYYREDLIHPTAMAEEYVWEKFSKVYFTDETIKLNQEWVSVKRALNHKPFQPQSEEHQVFLKSTLKKLEKLSSKLPVESEIAELKSKITLA